MNMKTFFVGIIFLALLAGCTQQGGYGGGGEGSDSTKGLKTGTAKSENQDVNTNDRQCQRHHQARRDGHVEYGKRRKIGRCSIQELISEAACLHGSRFLDSNVLPPMSLTIIVR